MNIKNNLGYIGILRFEFERDKSHKLEFHNNGKYPLFETIGKVLTGNISNDILIPTYLDIVILDSNKNIIKTPVFAGVFVCCVFGCVSCEIMLIVCRVEFI